MSYVFFFFNFMAISLKVVTWTQPHMKSIGRKMHSIHIYISLLFTMGKNSYRAELSSSYSLLDPPVQVSNVDWMN